jgi:hypothetical protein
MDKLDMTPQESKLVSVLIFRSESSNPRRITEKLPELRVNEGLHKKFAG